MAAGAASIGVYHQLTPNPTGTPSGLLLSFGALAIFVAFAGCLYFSFMTRRSEAYLRDTWRWFEGRLPTPPQFNRRYAFWSTVYEVLWIR